MLVKFNHSRQVGGVIYNKSPLPQTVPDKHAACSYFKLMEKAGDVIVMASQGVTKAQADAEAKAKADTQAKADADAKAKAEADKAKK